MGGTGRMDRRETRVEAECASGRWRVVWAVTVEIGTHSQAGCNTATHQRHRRGSQARVSLGGTTSELNDSKVGGTFL